MPGLKSVKPGKKWFKQLNSIFLKSIQTLTEPKRTLS
jgi:hypothetical protein